MRFEFSNDKSKLILKDSTKQEYNQLKLHLNRLIDGYFYKKKSNPKLFYSGWDGVVDHFHNGYINIGLWQEIYKCCKQYDFPFEINKKEFPFDNTITLEKVENFCKEFFVDYKDKNGKDFSTYEHQMNAVYKMLKYKCAITEVATSGGKTLICFILVSYILKNIDPNFKFLFIVPNINLVVQLNDDFYDYNNGYNKEQKNPLDLKVEEIMSDKPRKVRDGEIPNIYIGTYQSLVNYPDEFFTKIDFVLNDEAHLSKNNSFSKIMNKLIGTTQYRFGVSGTFPSEKSAEYITIQSLMGPKIISVKYKELHEKGIVADVKIKALILNYNDKNFAESVYNIKKYGKGQKAHQLEKEFAQNSDKRTHFLSKLVTKFDSNSLILFHNIEYGTKLYDYFRDNIKDKEFYYIDGSIDSKKRGAIKKIMEDTTGKPKILVASFGTLSTGVSIKAIMNIVFADSFKSDQIIRQSIGRGLRLHSEKMKLHVFDIVDRFHKDYKNILYNHFVSRRDTIYKKQEMPFEELNISI